MEGLSVVLPIVIYILLIVLIVVLIVIALKVIAVMNRVDRIVENVDDKVNSLNGIFNIIDSASFKLNNVYSKVISGVSSAVDKVFFSKESEDEEDE